MKLHYSQTNTGVSLVNSSVLLPYEITLFSNWHKHFGDYEQVLLPYEITLFSNITRQKMFNEVVLLPYEITLFSNDDSSTEETSKSFTTL